MWYPKISVLEYLKFPISNLVTHPNLSPVSNVHASLNLILKIYFFVVKSMHLIGCYWMIFYGSAVGLVSHIGLKANFSIWIRWWVLERASRLREKKSSKRNKNRCCLLNHLMKKKMCSCVWVCECVCVGVCYIPLLWDECRMENETNIGRIILFDYSGAYSHYLS